MKSLIKFCALAFTGLLSYQNHAQSVEIGARFMPTFSSFNAQSNSGGTVSGSVTLGYGVGGLVGFHFNDYVGVQVEGIYTRISQKFVEPEVTHKVDLKYINFPLLLSINTGKFKTVNFNLVVGPQIGLSAGSKITTTSNNNGVQTSSAVLSVKKGDLGFAYGAGLDFGLNPEKSLRLGIGFRGVYGLFDISDNSRNLNTESYYLLGKTHVKTYSGYIGVSYLF